MGRAERSGNPATARPNRLPTDFHRRVLDQEPERDHLVDATGSILYANDALLELGGWTPDENGDNFFDSIHPDDADWVAEAFVTLAATTDDHAELGRNRWATVHVRLVAADGSTISVEASGTDALLDPDVGGIIYHVRPARSQELLSDVLTGIAAGAPVDELLGAVLEIVAAPPLDLDAAILLPTSFGRYELLVATSDRLGDALRDVRDPTPWTQPADEPTFVALGDLPDEYAATLAAHGYRDLWHIAVESRMTSSTFRVIACSPTHHVPGTGVFHRLRRARELAAVVLLRSQIDTLLAHGAFHDHLTQLTNRAGLMNRLAGVATDANQALTVLYIDLDGFKPINDEFGHDAGDRVLQVTAQRLRDESRSNDLVARVGGDEFVVVLGTTVDPSTALERARTTADRLVSAIGQPIDVDGTVVQVSASIGVVVSESEATIKELLTFADRAMFTAKRAGGGRDQIYGG